MGRKLGIWEGLLIKSKVFEEPFVSKHSQPEMKVKA